MFGNARFSPVFLDPSDTGGANPPAGTITLTNPPLPTPSMTSLIPENYFTKEQVEALLSSTRKEEKDKLYATIEGQKSDVTAMKDQLAVLSAERESAQREAEARQATEAARLKKLEEDELSAKELVNRRASELESLLNKQKDDYEKRLNDLKQQAELADLLRLKTEEAAQLNAYKQQRLSQVGDQVAPVFLDLINGNTPDEIEASISLFTQKSQAIMEAMQFSQPRVRSVSSTGAAPSGPLDNSDTQTFSLDDIKNMDPNTFLKYRDQLLKYRG